MVVVSTPRPEKHGQCGDSPPRGGTIPTPDRRPRARPAPDSHAISPPAAKLADRCRDAGLLVSADEDNLLTLFPALTVEREVARQGLDILERCL